MFYYKLNYIQLFKLDSVEFFSLSQVLKAYSKEVIVQQPENIFEFSFRYFEQLEKNAKNEEEIKKVPKLLCFYFWEVGSVSDIISQVLVPIEALGNVQRVSANCKGNMMY